MFIYIGRRLFVISCIILIMTPQLFADDSATVSENQMDKESYSIGYQVGLSIKHDGVDVDLETLVEGLRDAIDGIEPRLSNEEMRSLIIDLKKEAQVTALRKFQEMTVRNAEESQKFLENNGKREGIKTTGSGLQYMVMREGDGATPGAEDFVTVHYRGEFIDGKEFDSSYARGKPQTFQTDGVIRGWTEALQMMKEGSKWKIFVPPLLAYGRSGLGERIPPNKVLVFEIELLSVAKDAKEVKN